MMRFSDHVFSIDTAGGAVRVRVTADVLHQFWGEGVGPQTADGLVAANREIIDYALGDKMIAGAIEDGEYVIRESDIDP